MSAALSIDLTLNAEYNILPNTVTANRERITTFTQSIYTNAYKRTNDSTLSEVVKIALNLSITLPNK